MTEKTKLEILTDNTVKFCKMMADEMGEDSTDEQIWKKYMPMATDFFLMEAYGRVRSKFWDEAAAGSSLCTFRGKVIKSDAV
jgi:hypothetical protein